MALAHHLLHGAGVAPEWIETDKEVRALRARIERLLERAVGSGRIATASLGTELERLADEHDARDGP